MNPHLFLLSKAMRNKSGIYAQSALAMTSRGGGGGFHKPDPKLPKLYQHTRLVHLEDMNTVLYHDFAPEYHMHLHSPFIQNSKQGLALQFFYFVLILVPAWWFASRLHRMAGAHLYPSVRPGKDHAHMAPALFDHLKANNYENKQDALGRRTGAFYKNFQRQMNDMEFKTSTVKAMESHGFKF